LRESQKIMKSETTKKGNIGLLAVAQEALKRGYIPSFPMEGTIYDLVLEKEGIFYRVQVKYVTPYKGSLFVKFDSTQGQNTQKYTVKDIDAIIVYNPNHETFYWIPIVFSKESLTITLRLFEAKNKQKKGVHRAEEFIQW